MKNVYLSLFFLILGALVSGCNKLGINQADGDAQAGRVSCIIDMNSAPKEVAAVEGVLYRPGSDSILIKFKIDSTNKTAKALVENIKKGDWKVTINALNANMTIIYSGTTTVQVIPGKITDITVRLLPVINGGINFIVIWGTVLDTTLFIAATLPWQSTGVYVSAGDSLIISSHGAWKVNGGHPVFYGPDGYLNGGWIGNTHYPLPGVIEGALAGKIGNGMPFLVGSFFSKKIVDQSGILYLAPNDDLYAQVGAGLTDNVGADTSRVLIIPQN